MTVYEYELEHIKPYGGKIKNNIFRYTLFSPVFLSWHRGRQMTRSIEAQPSLAGVGRRSILIDLPIRGYKCMAALADATLERGQ